MSFYKVTGKAVYRGHQPGAVFEAVLDEHAEQRAFDRGTITLLERSTPSLKPGSYKLPEKR